MKKFIIVTIIIIVASSLVGCETQSYDEGYKAGYQKGHDKGWDEGYQEGLEEAKSGLPQVELPDIKLPDVKLPDISIDITPNQESPITMELIVLGKSGDSYSYRTVLEEKSGIDFHITALTREFIETGYVWTGGRDYVLDRLGSYNIPANGKLKWETSFDLSEVRSYFDEHGVVTYRECWYGTDSNDNAIGVSYSISTSEF